MTDAYSLVFNSLNFGTNSDYRIHQIDVGMPRPELTKFRPVSGDGNIITSKYFGERIIHVEGDIVANNLNDMITKLDTLKSYTVDYEGELDVSLGNTVRRYVGTVQSFTYTTNGYHCQFKIDFSCDSFGLDTQATTLVFGTYTTSGTSYINPILGNHTADLNMDFTVNSVDPWWTAKYLEIKNSALNQRMQITRTWAWGDRVVINGLTKTATLYPSTQTLIDNADSTTGWTSSHTLTAETVLMKEGTGALKNSMATTATTLSYFRLNNAAVLDLSSTVGYILLPIFLPTPTSGTISSVRFTAGSNTTLGTNYVYWDVTTQADGSAIAFNAWNYFRIDLSAAVTGSAGTAVRTAIISLAIELKNGSAFDLDNVLLDYISIYKASVVGQDLDYEGLIPSLRTGTETIVISDEFTNRSIAIAGSGNNYYKRYL